MDATCYAANGWSRPGRLASLMKRGDAAELRRWLGCYEHRCTGVEVHLIDAQEDPVDFNGRTLGQTWGWGGYQSVRRAERLGLEPDTRLWGDLVGSRMAGFGGWTRKSAARLRCYGCDAQRAIPLTQKPIERSRPDEVMESPGPVHFWRELSSFRRYTLTR